MLVVLAMLVVGEAFAFLALGEPPPEPAIYQQVALGAIFAGLASVIVTALLGPIRPAFGADGDVALDPEIEA
jgi:hypothetical protein